MTDMVAAVQSYIANVQTTMDSVPSELQAAASSGDFGSMLSSIEGALGSTPQPTTSGAADSLTGSLFAGQSTPAGASATGSEVVNDAESELGVPYLWGGTTPQGFDCSGLVQYVYGELGINLPRTSEEQAQVGTPVDSLANAQPGDLVFFAGSDGTASSPGHVGIYVGNGQMIDAPQTGMTVSVQPIDPSAVVGIRRVLPEPTTGALNVPASLQPMFDAAAAQYGLPSNLLPAVADVESGFQTNEVSSAGAEGLMQLMPSTAAGLGVNPYDPQQAIDGAAQLLSNYIQQYGSIPLALAAYNAGPNAVASAGGSVPAIPQTEAYVQDITALMGSAQ